MKELGDILAALRGLTRQAVLATVVGVEGSTYRRPGARMLISGELAGGRVGSISGGCLEDEVCRRAMYLTEAGAAVVTYETGLDDEGSGSSYTLGCGGRVTVLFERIGPGLGYLEFVEGQRKAGHACAVATVVADGGGRAIGERPAMAGEEGERAGRDEALLAECVEALESGRSRYVAVDGGRVVFVEVVPAPVRLYVFGTGHDAEPVARLAAGLGWRVAVIGKAGDRVVSRVGHGVLGLTREAAWDELAGVPARRAAAIVMNHNYVLDLEVVTGLLASRAAYIGILGPRHRTDAMLSDVASSRSFESSSVAARMDLSRVHAPIGLDIGAESAEEVALAIVGEVQAFFAEREGGRLRDRSGAIHHAVGGSVGATATQANCGLGGGP